MNILVTGATGFLGQHLCSFYTKKNYNITQINQSHYNLLDYNKLSELTGKFDLIFHLAAVAKAGNWAATHSGEQWIKNQIINTNILKYWSEYQPQAKFITFGTSCAYAPKDTPHNENEYLIGIPDKDLYGYAHTKRMLLIGLQSLVQQYSNLKYLYLVPNTLFGCNFKQDDNHFIFDLIRKITRAKIDNSVAVLWGDGTQRRELIYVDDKLLSYIDFLVETQSNTIINIGSEDNFTIKHYADLICSIVNCPRDKIIFDPSFPSGVMRKKLSIDKIRNIIKDYHPTDLHDGLIQTIDYYKRNELKVD